MRWSQTLATLAPTVVLFGLIWCCRTEVYGILIYAPAVLLIIPVLSLLPLIVQVAWQSLNEVSKPPRPFAIVLPLGVLLLVLLLPAAERVARAIPWLCVAQTHGEVKPDRPGKSAPAGRFLLGANGWGNTLSYEFQMVTVVYAFKDRRFDDLYVDLPRWQGHYTNSYTTDFPLTREKLAEYVRRSDDFPAGEAEAVADKMWELLLKYKERRDIPPFGATDSPSRYWVPPENVYLASVLLSIPLLFALSWFLVTRQRVATP
jgi:hypothetical protein